MVATSSLKFLTFAPVVTSLLSHYVLRLKRVPIVGNTQQSKGNSWFSPLDKPGGGVLSYSPHPHQNRGIFPTFPASSMAERSAVNRNVGGSSPPRGVLPRFAMTLTLYTPLLRLEPPSFSCEKVGTSPHKSPEHKSPETQSNRSKLRCR